MFIPSLKEMIVMILIVVLVGTPITWAIETNEVESLNIEDIERRVVDATGFTVEELEAKSDEELEEILNNMVGNDNSLKELEDLFKGVDFENLSIEELKIIFQENLNRVLNEKLPDGEGKGLYIKGWNTILDKINSVEPIPSMFANIFDGLMEFTLKDAFKTNFSFPKLADFM